MTKTNLKSIAENQNNMLNGYNYAPHFRGKVREIRSMGYNPVHALLEFTDNSLREKCGSKNIIVKLHKSVYPPYILDRISVLDDGCGMNFEQLRESFIFNIVKERESGDIGKFHVGGKYAAIALGEEVVYFSKEKGCAIVGLHADVRQMQENNSFAPTEISENVDEEWALRFVPITLWNQFKEFSSGTLIHIRNLVPNVRTDFEKHHNEFLKNLSISYTSRPNDCVIILEDREGNQEEIPALDIFYKNNPSMLDEIPYETTLAVYREFSGNPSRVIEINTSIRKMKRKDLRCGTPEKPRYFEYKANTSKLVTEISASELPSDDNLIGYIRLRFIQVNKKQFEEEKKWFPVGDRLCGNRKGFWFIRDVRMVGAAKKLNKTFADRVVMANERQRCLVSFPDKLDEEVGSKFNKQMEDNSLPCMNLDVAIKQIYSDVMSPWTAKWKQQEKKESITEEEEEDEQVTGDDTQSAEMSETGSEHTMTDNESVSKENKDGTDNEDVKDDTKDDVKDDTKDDVKDDAKDDVKDDAKDDVKDDENTHDDNLNLPSDDFSLSFNNQTNTLTYQSPAKDNYTILVPGNGHYLYEWLRSIPNPNHIDEMIEHLSNRFPC